MICQQSKKRYIESFDFTSVPFKRVHYSLLEEAANEFLYHFSQNFLLLHSEQD